MRVRLVDVPVGLFCAAEQHANDLLREVALMAAASPDDGHLFLEVLAAADAFAQRPSGVRNRVAESVSLAQRQGWPTVTVDVDADAEAADAALDWEELLQRFDAMSRDERVLTLPADRELATYRAWYVREIVEQVRTGRPPVSWYDVRTRTLAGAAH